jgi:hypothetical protein
MKPHLADDRLPAVSGATHRSRAWPGVPIVFMLLAASCAPVPKVELAAYTTAYSETYAVTNGVLDIVVPYERVVLRNASTTGTSSNPGPTAARVRDDAETALLIAQTEVRPPRPAPAPDPTLLADPSTVRPARPMPAPDPTLLADPKGPTTPGRAPIAGSAPTRPTPALAPDLPTIACRGVGGTAPFCYETRDAYADIGDPPLVAAYRRLASVVFRFNALLVAYGNGISGTLLQQDLDGLASSVTDVTQLGLIAGISGVGSFASGFGTAIQGLAPIANKAGEIADRAQLRTFLLNNYALVDQALEAMARNSVDLYANVAVGTNLFRRMKPPGQGEVLTTRRDDIRRLIANWTVLLDDARRLLRELKAAIEAPNGLESRLRNLDPPTQVQLDTSLVKKQIANLGAPTLAP